MHVTVAAINHQLGNYEQAIIHFNTALQANENYDMLPLNEIYIGLADSYVNIGDTENANLYKQKAGLDTEVIQIDEKVIEYSRLGSEQAGAGNFDKSIEHYTNALDLVLKEEESVDKKILVATIYKCIGGVNQMKGDFEKALNYYEQNLSIYNELYNIRQEIGFKASIFDTYFHILFLSPGSKRCNEIIGYLENEVNLFNKNGPADRPYLGSCYRLLALAHYKTGKYLKCMKFGGMAKQLINNEDEENFSKQKILEMLMKLCKYKVNEDYMMQEILDEVELAKDLLGVDNKNLFEKFQVAMEFMIAKEFENAAKEFVKSHRKG